MRSGFLAVTALVLIVSLMLLSCGGGGGGGTDSSAATLVSIAVTPARSSIAIGATQQFTATGTYSDAASLDITALVTWASDTTAVATINTGGLAAGIAGGVSTITASLEAISGITTLTVSTVPDTTPPAVASTSPGTNATGVSVSALITATFTEEVDAATVNGTNFTIDGVTGTVTYDAGTKTATFAPSNLAGSTTYTATITSGVKDLAGNAMTADKTWTFTTGTGPDVMPPVVSSSTPGNMATGVTTTNAKMTVLFNEPMNVGLFPTLATEAYNGTAWVAIPNVGTTLTWTSSTTLAINLSWLQFPEVTNIRWTLTAVGLEDAAGNQVASDVQRSFTTSARNTYFPIADTGQSICFFFSGSWTWDANCLDFAPVYTVGSANNPFGQDGHYASSPRAWNFSGPTAYVLYPNDRTTSDNVTGLVWKTCIEGQLGADCAGEWPVSRNWYDAVNACTTLNGANGGAGYGGRTHWRLPTKAEIESFPSYGIAGFSINDLYFPNSFQSDKYWTASTAAFDPALAWTASALYGDILSKSKTENSMARCVAASDPSTIQVLSDNGNGTILDNVNDLMWQKCSMGQNVDSTCSGAAVAVVWAAAVNYCENLNFVSRTDWRLPNVHELQTLTAASPSGPAIDVTMFPHTASAGYWTGSPHGDFPVFSWYVSFGGGETSSGDKSSLLAVRCVAGP